MMEVTSTDALALAQEYSSASDEDVLHVMKVQASQKASDLEELSFYVVPGDWMRKAWPYLVHPSTAGDTKDPDWKEKAIGRIVLADLLVRNHEISDEEDEERHIQEENKQTLLQELQTHSSDSPSKPQQRKMSFSKAQRHTKPELRRDILIWRDFFLVGPSTWKFIKLHFGFDQEVKRPVARDGRHLVVILNEANDHHPINQEPIPASGRFAYEALVAGQDVDCVSDDENDFDDWDIKPAADMDVLKESPTTQPILLLPGPDTSDRNASPTYRVGWNSVAKTEEIVESRVVLRRYGSGLGQLGNTCFMNSSIQCLTHTDPLRKYFLSGDYEVDLNRDNPLGTGGELAQDFAKLVADMWLTTQRPSLARNYGYNSTFSSDPDSTGNVVYPRNFKYTLGKHAEQFMGYDQHDSQELATYLLDALHEDTNRVTKKPYVEKPEQGENETDEMAAQKAWDLHLKRENSYIMELFMAQVKSRVQCSEPECGRVSTTFDPIMFLSVPIPGSSERTMRVIFVPLDPKQRPKSFGITINKLASINDMLVRVQERILKSELAGPGVNVQIEDLLACDLWQNDIYSWHDPNKEISTIRDTDETVVYQLEPLQAIRKIEQEIQEQASAPVDETLLGLRKEMSHQKRLKLDYEEMTRLKGNDQWLEELRNFIHPRSSNPTILDIKYFSTKERVDFLNKLNQFIDLCWKEVEENETSGQKRGRGMGRESSTSKTATSDFSPIRGIEERSDTHRLFKAKSLHDLAVLDFIAKQLRREILDAEKEKQSDFPDGVTIEIRMKKHVAGYSSKDGRLGSAFVMRIPSNMTVYQFREEIARRMNRAIRISDKQSANTESSPVQLSPFPATDAGVESGFGSPGLLCLRQMPLTYQRKGYGNRVHTGELPLGSIEPSHSLLSEASNPMSLASNKSEKEQDCVAELVGDCGVINLEWPLELAERYFDRKEYDTVDDLDAIEGTTKQNGSKTISVVDCIDKFCQKEQLDESEMWYCSQCKQHVRAWKQFHIYKSPPILLIHLKRFHYSSRSHRRDKISTFIDFPLKDLDLSDQVISWEEGCKPVYDCYAVSNHYGGLGGGHYTAYCLNNDGSWCYYDDSRITTNVDPKEVISDAAYVLYYRRKDVVVGEEFDLQMPRPTTSSPALIQAERGLDSSSRGSSNIAMAGDDMDIDPDDAGSCLTAPMGSVSDQNDPLSMDDGLYSDEVTVEGEQESDIMPLQ
ncbi:ubiquitin carboxyl-terminal hydrolase 4/11 [Fistulifera solaris]|uniref:Ubiquitin carboxyl-terminal hydrolase 4/11 n=1 Tax=Fistulifera solaris TaxID=1519565 RepID=A0A1Z5K3F5_FISSO|nr:ubiquitin carboxyl-terminal hydrolase 4/11 [Fistulifera solaris]|eukprot:GAX20611.1 ubiquitin carboxyl-terminal hydrolase 4/11 [Fistulifera solaris]